jgi:Domain of unknown function (DUF6894)
VLPAGRVLANGLGGIRHTCRYVSLRDRGLTRAAEVEIIGDAACRNGPEGQEFADDEAARQEARAVARDLSQNRNPASDERVVVTDADGKVIHEEPLFRR